jgi:hypothetical protein
MLATSADLRSQLISQSYFIIRIHGEEQVRERVVLREKITIGITKSWAFPDAICQRQALCQIDMEPDMVLQFFLVSSLAGGFERRSIREDRCG